MKNYSSWKYYNIFHHDPLKKTSHHPNLGHDSPVENHCSMALLCVTAT